MKTTNATENIFTGNAIESDQLVLEPPKSWKYPKHHLECLLASPWYSTIMEICSVLNLATHQFFVKNGARIAFSPVTTDSISSPMGLGSDSLPVKADIQGHTVYLADSMQFSLELALRVTGRMAYYIQPSFRGEESDSRHLNQFVHAEAELYGGLEDVINTAEMYFRDLSKALVSECPEALLTLGGSPENVNHVAGLTAGFPRVTFAEAYRILKDVDGAFESCETGDLKITDVGERHLLAMHHHSPVWIIHMPASTVPFYQAVSEADPNISLTADLLAGIGETIGAGERAETQANVLSNLDRCNVSSESYGWYLEMKRLKPARTAGFGLGLERFMLWATQCSDIRDFAFLLRNEFGEGRP